MKGEGRAVHRGHDESRCPLRVVLASSSLSALGVLSALLASASDAKPCMSGSVGVRVGVGVGVGVRVWVWVWVGAGVGVGVGVKN